MDVYRFCGSIRKALFGQDAGLAALIFRGADPSAKGRKIILFSDNRIGKAIIFLGYILEILKS
jgi:hypothetical protein